MSRENIQQLKAMLRKNTVLVDLELAGSALGSAGLPEIASVLYRNRTIEVLNISDNRLDDVASATILRELTCRNKTIFDLCISDNPFGRDNAAVQIIADGLCDSGSLCFIDLTVAFRL
jgi:Ran GTPase-activating protein (RanGAP) involved in mRNA processing and transport